MVTENAEKLIPAGSYPGKVRMVSKTNIVQSSGGQLGKKGDFLLEIADVPKHSDILIHPSNNVKSTEGYVVAGRIDSKDRTSFTAIDSVAFKLRLHFYGRDTPNF